MNICYLVFRPDSLTYTICKAISANSHRVDLVITDPGYIKATPTNIQRRITGIPSLSVMVEPPKGNGEIYDRLVIQVYPRLMESDTGIQELASRASKITLITSGDRNRPPKSIAALQRMEIWKMRKWWTRIDRVAYKDGYYAFDLYRVLKERRVVGFDVHSQFLDDEDAYHSIHERKWMAGVERSIFVNFMGSKDPAIRLKALNGARDFFAAANSINPGVHSKSWFWLEYSDDAPAGLSSTEFLDVLSDSDFTLSPPGYSLVTHRPMEALLCGSIPVLNAAELDLYDIGLTDGVNCIAVHKGCWADAMERIKQISANQIIAMRNNINLMRDRLLSYPVSSARMCNRLGL